ncbi:MAG TPA: hypothetical protein DIU37_01470 [Opitutae bacterium]|nr:hypothetical protein [Opitutae bacterium]
MFTARKQHSRQAVLKRILILISIPLLWILVDESWNDDPDFLNPLENKVLDWQFQVRGELEAPVKVFYVDIDAQALHLIGDPPWDYSYFADAARILFNLGEVKAIGFDIGFSPRYKNSQLVSERKAWESDRAFSEVMHHYPNIVLAADYQETVFDRYSGENTMKFFPYLDDGFVFPEKNPFPDMPTYPIVSERWGVVGLVDRYPEFDAGPVSRWVPLFSEYAGTAYARHIMEGVLKYEGLPESNLTTEGDREVLLDEEGRILYELPRYSNNTFYSMALQLALMYYDLDEDALQYRTTRLKAVDSGGNVVLEMPLANRQVIEINWFSKWKNDKLNPRCSLAELFNRARDFYEGSEQERVAAKAFFDQLHGAIVLVGATDPSLLDLAPTPFDATPVPNVGIQGNLIKTLVSGLYIKRLPVWATMLVIGLLTALLTGIVIYRGVHSVVYDTAVIILFFTYLVFVFLAFNLWHLVLPVVAPVGAAVTTMIAGLVMRIIDYERQKRRMRNHFGTYIAPDLVSRMVERREEPQLGGVEESITSFFSDIEQFTLLSEELRPSELVTLINEYLEVMTEVLRDAGGTLDKYIGDAIVAMFGAPVPIQQHSLQACMAAVRIHARQRDLCVKWRKDVHIWPQVVLNMRTRIGLSAGFATVGNMGSKTRFNYTMMGDTVNLAARAEQAAKVYGVSTVLTEATKREVEDDSDAFVFRFLDDVVVQGKKAPVSFYELVGLRSDIPPSFEDCLELYEKGRERYLSRDWLGAYAFFEKAVKFELPRLRKSGVEEMNSNMVLSPSHLFMERCRKMHENPPGEEWEGIYRMESK